jgi:hypothetical protein
VAWKLLPNLGLDVLALPAFRLLPPLAAAKAIIILIFAVQFGGVLALNRALNGRMSIAAALLAGILLYSYIFIWGASPISCSLTDSASGVWRYG